MRLRIVLLIAALPLFGQEKAPEQMPPPASPQASPFHSAVELQAFRFGNFFQTGAGIPERNVNAFGAAYRASWTHPNSIPDLYGRVSTLRYSGGASETSYTGQVGFSKYASVHWYDVYLEHTRNGYAMDIDETRASADITALGAHYSYGINRDWRVGTDLYMDWTRFNVDAGLENDYHSLGFDVRYRGFGDLFQPRVGYVSGQRDSRNGQEDASDHYWFVELRTKPSPAVDVRLRYRDRERDYENVSRVDDRSQWTLRGTVRQNAHISWEGSYSAENVDSSVAGRDYDRNTAYLGLIYGF